ncbi:MAG: Coenzyme F420 hydrogenase/dehydrogenase, beta subunit C-terminal domain [Clostridia bacterium]|nr:Coenzyme F420 hydrogenase/dehydrogenase, beta subunit C-terminal domain [Clostridia bacterium]
MRAHISIRRPEECCGCGACVNACAPGAITMQEDEAGFIYPAVDEALCVNCGRCVDVCVFTQKEEGANGAPQVYAAAVKDKSVLKDSSSGGIFTAIADAVLDKGGVVFGASWTDDLTVEHTGVSDRDGLAALRGSKYVQSSTGDTFSQVKKLLKDGRYVCYSGTPCQIAGLKAFLGAEYENLLTVDLVCHGVPSMKMLRDDLDFVSKGNVSGIRDIRFRDKQYGWGTRGSFLCGDSKVKYNAGTSAYYFYFLKGEVYRESCYHCRFPSEGRQGDITLGDYWGVREELISEMGGADPELGVSCVLVNTEKGKRWFSAIGNSVCVARTDRASVEKRNKQLTAHSTPLPEHSALLNGYIKTGYAAFRKGYKKHIKDHVIRTAKNMIPSRIKRKLSNILF